jgi:hypothetical protein
MKKLALLLAMICLFIPDVQASQGQIKKIKKIYYQTKKDIEDGNLLIHSLSLRTMIPGIGGQTTKVNFYYLSVQKEESIEMLPPVLRKITSEYSVAASVTFKFEYVFDKSSDLVFFFKKVDGYECGEERYYFSKSKPVKIKIDPGKSDCIGDEATKNFKALDKTGVFTAAQLKNAKAISDKSKKYKNIFDALVKFEQIEK